MSLVSVSIPAMIFKIVLEQTKWWTTLNGIHVLNASIEKRILGLMAWSFIVLFAWIIIQIIIADIYDDITSYRKKPSSSQPNVDNLSKIKQVISAFNSHIILHYIIQFIILNFIHNFRNHLISIPNYIFDSYIHSFWNCLLSY